MSMENLIENIKKELQSIIDSYIFELIDEETCQLAKTQILEYLATQVDNKTVRDYAVSVVIEAQQILVDVAVKFSGSDTFIYIDLKSVSFQIIDL